MNHVIMAIVCANNKAMRGELLSRFSFCLVFFRGTQLIPLLLAALAMQFRALSDQLYETSTHHSGVRQQVVKQLRSSPEFYKGFVGESCKFQIRSAHSCEFHSPPR
jgi:hypothetical protein